MNAILTETKSSYAAERKRRQNRGRLSWWQRDSLVNYLEQTTTFNTGTRRGSHRDDQNVGGEGTSRAMELARTLCRITLVRMFDSDNGGSDEKGKDDGGAGTVFARSCRVFQSVLVANAASAPRQKPQDASEHAKSEDPDDDDDERLDERFVRLISSRMLIYTFLQLSQSFSHLNHRPRRRRRSMTTTPISTTNTKPTQPSPKPTQLTPHPTTTTPITTPTLALLSLLYAHSLHNHTTIPTIPILPPTPPSLNSSYKTGGTAETGGTSETICSTASLQAPPRPGLLSLVQWESVRSDVSTTSGYRRSILDAVSQSLNGDEGNGSVMGNTAVTAPQRLMGGWGDGVESLVGLRGKIVRWFGEFLFGGLVVGEEEEGRNRRGSCDTAYCSSDDKGRVESLLSLVGSSPLRDLTAEELEDGILPWWNVVVEELRRRGLEGGYGVDGDMVRVVRNMGVFVEVLGRCGKGFLLERYLGCREGEDDGDETKEGEGDVSSDILVLSNNDSILANDDSDSDDVESDIVGAVIYHLVSSTVRPNCSSVPITDDLRYREALGHLLSSIALAHPFPRGGVYTDSTGTLKPVTEALTCILKGNHLCTQCEDDELHGNSVYYDDRGECTGECGGCDFNCEDGSLRAGGYVELVTAVCRTLTRIAVGILSLDHLRDGEEAEWKEADNTDFLWSVGYAVGLLLGEVERASKRTPVFGVEEARREWRKVVQAAENVVQSMSQQSSLALVENGNRGLETDNGSVSVSSACSTEIAEKRPAVAAAQGGGSTVSWGGSSTASLDARIAAKRRSGMVRSSSGKSDGSSVVSGSMDVKIAAKQWLGRSTEGGEQSAQSQYGSDDGLRAEAAAGRMDDAAVRVAIIEGRIASKLKLGGGVATGSNARSVGDDGCEKDTGSNVDSTLSMSSMSLVDIKKKIASSRSMPSKSDSGSADPLSQCDDRIDAKFTGALLSPTVREGESATAPPAPDWDTDTTEDSADADGNNNVAAATDPFIEHDVGHGLDAGADREQDAFLPTFRGLNDLLDDNNEVSIPLLCPTNNTNPNSTDEQDPFYQPSNSDSNLAMAVATTITPDDLTEGEEYDPSAMDRIKKSSKVWLAGGIILSLVVAIIVFRIVRKEDPPPVPPSSPPSSIPSLSPTSWREKVLAGRIGTLFDVEGGRLWDGGDAYGQAMEWLVTDPLVEEWEENEEDDWWYDQALEQRFCVVLFYFEMMGDRWKNCSRVTTTTTPTEKNCTVMDRDHVVVSNRTRWLSESHECEWGGIICDMDSERLSGIHLNGLGLKGTIPSEIAKLTGLQELYLMNDDIRGTIPSEIGTLSNLVAIDLRTNNLTSGIPLELYSLTELMDLTLAYNGLSGMIASDIGKLTALTVLNVKP